VLTHHGGIAAKNICCCEQADNASLMDAMKLACTEMGLQPVATFLDKVTSQPATSPISKPGGAFSAMPCCTPVYSLTNYFERDSADAIS